MHVRAMKLLYCLPAIVLAFVVSTGMPAHGALPTPVKLSPEPQHSNVDQAIAGLLSHYHYRKSNLDDELSRLVMDNYLEALDFSRLYFLASDVAAFRASYGEGLDDALKRGDLTPAYHIFLRFQERLVERTERIHERLATPFDFTADEYVELDRQESPWAGDLSTLDGIWAKRLKHEALNLVLAGKSEPDARKTLEERYDARLRRTLQSNSEDVFQTYMNALSRSFDPHTAYFSPRATENFNIQMRLSLEGIGTVLRMEEEQVTVQELVPGGPADLTDQVGPGDVIVGVAQGDDDEMVDIVGWRLDDVVDLIRGPRGTVVRLLMNPADSVPGTTKTVRIVRETVQLEKQAAQSEIRQVEQDGRSYRLGIVTIPTFYSDFAAAQRGETDYRSTTRDVRRLLEALDDDEVDGLVIDLRQNGGGSLQEAVELTGLFIPGGPVVQVRSSTGEVEVETDPDPRVAYDGPLTVLVDRYSASASEIFAGAIQDYGRGLVVGDPTFGKGTVQTLIDLGRFLPRSDDPLGQLKLTIAKFYRVSGGSTQNRGVTPDIALPSPFVADDVGESAQPRALPYDEIPPVSFRPSGHLSGLVTEIASRHRSRIDQDPAFQALQEDIDAAEIIRKTTRLSLSESKRREERTQREAASLMRENKIRVAMGLEPVERPTGSDIESQEEEAFAMEEEDKLPDVLLSETTRILADLVNLLEVRGRGEALVMSDS